MLTGIIPKTYAYVILDLLLKGFHAFVRAFYLTVFVIDVPLSRTQFMKMEYANVSLDLLNIDECWSDLENGTDSPN